MNPTTAIEVLPLCSSLAGDADSISFAVDHAFLRGYAVDLEDGTILSRTTDANIVRSVAGACGVSSALLESLATVGKVEVVANPDGHEHHVTVAAHERAAVFVLAGCLTVSFSGREEEVILRSGQGLAFCTADVRAIVSRADSKINERHSLYLAAPA